MPRPSVSVVRGRPGPVRRLRPGAARRPSPRPRERVRGSRPLRPWSRTCPCARLGREATRTVSADDAADRRVRPGRGRRWPGTQGRPRSSAGTRTRRRGGSAGTSRWVPGPDRCAASPRPIVVARAARRAHRRHRDGGVVPPDRARTPRCRPRRRRSGARGRRRVVAAPVEARHAVRRRAVRVPGAAGPPSHRSVWESTVRPPLSCPGGRRAPRSMREANSRPACSISSRSSASPISDVLPDATSALPVSVVRAARRVQPSAVRLVRRRRPARRGAPPAGPLPGGVQGGGGVVEPAVVGFRRGLRLDGRRQVDPGLGVTARSRGCRVPGAGGRTSPGRPPPPPRAGAPGGRLRSRRSSSRHAPGPALCGRPGSTAGPAPGRGPDRTAGRRGRARPLRCRDRRPRRRWVRRPNRHRNRRRPAGARRRPGSSARDTGRRRARSAAPPTWPSTAARRVRSRAPRSWSHRSAAIAARTAVRAASNRPAASCSSPSMDRQADSSSGTSPSAASWAAGSSAARTVSALSLTAATRATARRSPAS